MLGYLGLSILLSVGVAHKDCGDRSATSSSLSLLVINAKAPFMVVFALEDMEDMIFSLAVDAYSVDY